MRKTVHDLLAEARASLRRLEPFRAYAAMQQGARLIDTRSDDERAKHGSIPGSLHIPLSVLEWRADPDSGHHDPAIGGFGDPIILICAHGFSSSLAARRLQDSGLSTPPTSSVGSRRGRRRASRSTRRSRMPWSSAHSLRHKAACALHGTGCPGRPSGVVRTARSAPAKTTRSLQRTRAVIASPGPERQGARLVQAVVRGGQCCDDPVVPNPDDRVSHYDAHIDLAENVEGNPVGAGASASTVAVPALLSGSMGISTSRPRALLATIILLWRKAIPLAPMGKPNPNTAGAVTV